VIFVGIAVAALPTVKNYRQKVTWQQEQVRGRE
jgi:hypothetical protein